MLKILHVHTRYRQWGGEDSVVEAERDLLSRAGFEVIPFDFQNPGGTMESAAALAMAPWNSGAAKRVLQKATDCSVDLVHVHNTWFALSPLVVAELRQADFPVVMTFHNYRLVCVNAMLFREGQPCELCVGRGPVPGIRYRCYRESRLASAAAAATIAIHRRRRTWDELSVAVTLTDFARERLIEGGLPAERTVVKGNFVSDPGERSRPPSASNQVVFVGRLSIEKGIEQMLRAWEDVRPGLELVVIGTGPLEDRIRTLASPSVRLLGWLPPEQVREKMLGARALVVPSLWYEGQPMVILEALASGLPVLHNDIGALGEVCGKGGIAFRWDDQESFGGAVASLEEADLLDRTGRAGRAEFRGRFTEERSLEVLGGIYDLALGSDPPVGRSRA